MSKTKFFLLIILNGWNNFSSKISVDNPQQMIKESLISINGKNLNKNFNHFLDGNDKRISIVIVSGFFTIFSFSMMISSLGLFLQFFQNNNQDNTIKLPLKITIIIGFIAFIWRLTFIFTRFTSYLFHGYKIPFIKNLGTNIFCIIFTLFFLFVNYYTLNKTNFNALYNIYFILKIIITMFVFIMTIYGIYQNKQRIKKKLINPIIDNLYTKIVDVLSVFLSLVFYIIIYFIVKIRFAILNNKKWFELLNGLIYLIIILIVFYIRNMKIQDNLIILLSFFIAYIFWKLFFVFRKNIDNPNNIIQFILSLEIMFFMGAMKVFYRTHKANQLLMDRTK